MAEELKPGHVQITEEKFNQLLKQIDDFEADSLVAHSEIKIMYECMLSMMALVGLYNDGVIHPTIIEKGGNPMPILMKSGANLFLLFSSASLPGNRGRKAQEKIHDKFKFLGIVMPLVQKYHIIYNGK